MDKPYQQVSCNLTYKQCYLPKISGHCKSQSFCNFNFQSHQRSLRSLEFTDGQTLPKNQVMKYFHVYSYNRF